MHGADTFRGGEGPLHVSRMDSAQPRLLNQAFVASGAAAGYGRTEDQNGWRQEGFGPMDMTVPPLLGTRVPTPTSDYASFLTLGFAIQLPP